MYIDREIADGRKAIYECDREYARQYQFVTGIREFSRWIQAYPCIDDYGTMVTLIYENNEMYRKSVDDANKIYEQLKAAKSILEQKSEVKLEAVKIPAGSLQDILKMIQCHRLAMIHVINYINAQRFKKKTFRELIDRVIEILEQMPNAAHSYIDILEIMEWCFFGLLQNGFATGHMRFLGKYWKKRVKDMEISDANVQNYLEGNPKYKDPQYMKQLLAYD